MLNSFNILTCTISLQKNVSSSKIYFTSTLRTKSILRYVSYEIIRYGEDIYMSGCCRFTTLKNNRKKFMYYLKFSCLKKFKY